MSAFCKQAGVYYRMTILHVVLSRQPVHAFLKCSREGNCTSDRTCVLQLCDLYENDCIFDKFDCAISGNGQYVTTGSYNNFLKVTGRQGGPETIVEASRDPLRKRLQPQAKVQRPVSHSNAHQIPCSPASLRYTDSRDLPGSNQICVTNG